MKTYTFLIAGILIMTIALIWSVKRASQDSAEAGWKFYLGWGSFQIRYIISHWDTMKYPVLVWVIGALLFAVGVWIGRAAHVFR